MPKPPEQQVTDDGILLRVVLSPWVEPHSTPVTCVPRLEPEFSECQRLMGAGVRYLGLQR